MSRSLTFIVLAALLLGAAFGQPVVGFGQQTSSKAVFLEVHLPPNAHLDIGGYMTRSIGNVRVYQSPPIQTGYSYHYLLQATWNGKTATRAIMVQPGERATIRFSDADFQGQPAVSQQPAAKQKSEPAGSSALPTKPDFVTIESEGRWWIFRAGSKELEGFKKLGEPEKSVTRVNVAPFHLTLRSSDVATLEEYLATKPGFVTKYEDGRLWIFRADSKDFKSFLKDGELAKHVVRPGAGPGGLTIKAPDSATILGYVGAKEGFEVIPEEDRLWVFRAGSKDLAEFRKQGELARHVIRINAGPLGVTLKAPDTETLDAYMTAK